MSAAVSLPNAPTGIGSSTRNAVPFRRATIERTDILPAETAVQIGAAAVRIERTIEGSGYVYGLMLNMVAVAAGNAATVVLAEDAPWSALDTVTYRDVNGELINLNGYDLFISNLINKQYANRFFDQSNAYVATVGAVAAGGSFNYWIRVPIALNRRDLTGIVGNQDRAQKYSLRTDVAASASIWTTAPTTIPTVTINKIYENYAVPLPMSPAGAPQNVYPDSYGTLHFITGAASEAQPQGGGQINHYLRRIGNTIRWIALIFRSNGLRATAETNAPTMIQFKAGDDTQFTESYQYRRAIMYERYGFDFPPGVLVYEAMHDFQNEAGFELGDDYWHTQALTQAQFLITYPAGFGSTNNSLRIIVDDLLYQPPVANMSSVMTGR